MGRLGGLETLPLRAQVPGLLQQGPWAVVTTGAGASRGPGGEGTSFGSQPPSSAGFAPPQSVPLDPLPGSQSRNTVTCPHAHALGLLNSTRHLVRKQPSLSRAGLPASRRPGRILRTERGGSHGHPTPSLGASFPDQGHLVQWEWLPGEVAGGVSGAGRESGYRWPQYDLRGTGHELTVSSPWPRLPRGPLLCAGHLRERGLAAEALWGPGGQGQGLHQALHRQPERQVGGRALSSLLHFYSLSEERPVGPGHRPAWCHACPHPAGRASLNFPT